jgi:hypothetical protein
MHFLQSCFSQRFLFPQNMATNTYKTKPKTTSQSEGRSLFTLIRKYVRFDFIFEQGLPVRYIPYLLYLTALGIFYIANRNYAEKTTAKLARLKTEVDDLRTDYITQKAEYMIQSKQSEVAKKVKDLGLEESETPPYKIVVEK